MKKIVLIGVLTTSLIFLSATHSRLNIDYGGSQLDPTGIILAQSTPSLRFPLPGYTAYDAPIRNVFDHSTQGAPYLSTQSVVAYTGEYGGLFSELDACGCYKQSVQQRFMVNGNYTGVATCGGSGSLCYDGHPGTDYLVEENTPVRAAAAGTVHLPDIFPGFYNAQAYNAIEIVHSGGYRTYYLHLNKQLVHEGQQVAEGQLIGLSGDVGTSAPYLHFEVQKDGVPVDPYGWEGTGPDPYVDTVNKKLWATAAYNSGML